MYIASVELFEKGSSAWEAPAAFPLMDRKFLSQVSLLVENDLQVLSRVRPGDGSVIDGESVKIGKFAGELDRTYFVFINANTP